jgi:hypothetical protein
MTTLGLAVIGAGIVLIYAGIKGDDLPSILIGAFTGHPASSGTNGIAAAGINTGQVGAAVAGGMVRQAAK